MAIPIGTRVRVLNLSAHLDDPGTGPLFGEVIDYDEDEDCCEVRLDRSIRYVDTDTEGWVQVYGLYDYAGNFEPVPEEAAG